MCAPEENEFAEVFSDRDSTMTQAQRIFQATASLAGEAGLMDGIVVGKNTTIREIFANEISTLQSSCRCQCNDWSKVYLILSNDSVKMPQNAVLESLISDTRFDGRIILDLTEDETYGDDSLGSVDGKNDWVRLPPGIHSNLLIIDSVFKLRSCRVYRNSFVSNTLIGSNAAVIQCGYISCSNDPVSYGRLSISVGPESGGGRELNLTCEHTMIEVCRQLRNGPTSLPLLTNNTSIVPLNYIGEGCIVRDTPTIRDVFLHSNSSIEAATSVSHATLFPTSKIRGSCTVSQVILQWDSSISDHSTVTETLLMEHAHCGPHGIVASTVLGPDVHVSAGEVHASIVGPNTNAHHQSLVIGVLWPLGRGNVGYGANVGSNHTGRLPDQETAAGEGVFWGLSSVIKFPVDMSFAPYSVVAAGTTLSPQRICMPFSLIVENGKSNEIIPGWVLQSSPYTLARSEKKYATRRKASRHHHYTGWKIFRPETMAMCRWAKQALESGAAMDKTSGVGQNELSTRARDVGIRAYNDGLQRYALHGLLQRILRETDSGKMTLDMKLLERELGDVSSSELLNIDPMAAVEWPIFPWEMKGATEWEFQRALVQELFPLNQKLDLWLEDVLLKLVALEKDFACRIYKSKSRDDTRGAKVIPGYTNSHIPAEKDTVICEAQSSAKQIDSAVAEVLTTTGTRSRL